MHNGSSMKTLTGVFCTILALCLVAQDAHGIPAFARKYNMSCTTCHRPFPRLKDFGNDYAANGYQLPGGDPPRAFRDTGDDFLQLMRELPVAVRFDGFVRWLPQESGKSDFETPYVIKLLSGGQIAKNISYYFYFLFGERGEVGGLEDAFVMFNNLFRTELDFTIGQFQVCDPLFKRELRLTLEDYVIYGVKPGRSNTDLTYDRGVIFFYGLPTGTDFTLQVVNGSGLSPMDASNAFDTDAYKNPSLRISQDIGDHVRLGLFGYLGKEEDQTQGAQNSLSILGPDLTVSLGKFQLNAQYLVRNDNNADLLSSGGDKTVTRGGFAELIYLPDADNSLWYGVLLYNGVNSDYRVTGEDVPSPDYESVTAHLGYLLARNFRVVGEYTYDIQNKANALTVGLVAAF
jgi:hypothetical protein